MLDHLGVPVADLDATVGFWTTVFAPLGLREITRFPTGPESWLAGLGGGDGAPFLWFHSGMGAPVDQELHIALAADAGQVEAVHRAAVQAGAEVLHAPREWPEYHPGYYAVFLRDPNGHNAEAVCHTGGPSAPDAAGLAESSG
ncbi:catechol 2,3-dioxygenase-like lactoylglutathione lyase family enzyme [Friedmanniella endophytica]|uniref:Catechol 2,3-dioxygenase-like lactoylglutathione lyase family enzyme n=1 Tax=Microlunatus kandeliicorticis TaxID=1759536 RepID=A0A7W3ITK7_9ACTN|nr:VOC family protein [Microlunatus kandeliicorticis]MBA8794958.1 catechol 2,3-dioxygenase-like lactoylglutathione lyase family enzyme [Microlunatus kandeliicorticis]